MENSYKQVFGRNLERLRALKGLDQKQLGNIAGVSQKTVSNLENKSSDVSPTLGTVAKIADHFRIHPGILIMEDLTDDALTDSEVSLMLERFVQLSPDHKRRIMELISDLWQLRDQDN